jgi:hypothetical protein
VPAGTYTLTIGPAGPDDATTGDLNLTANVTITGAGAGATTIKGSGDRIFDITAASVTLSGLAITNGSGQQFGGAIKTTGAALTLTNDAFTGNTAASLGFGGAVYDQAPGSSNLTVTNSTFTSNIAADTTTGQGGFGGAISFEPSTGGTLAITNSEFDSNAAQSGSLSGGGFGGAIDFEPDGPNTLTVTGSTFNGNDAAGGSSSQGGFGGGIEYEPGAGPSSMTVTNSTFTGNAAGGPSGFGGAISYEPSGTASLAITHSTIVGNSVNRASQGGGLDIEDAPVTITNSIVSGNTAAGATNNCQVFSPATLTVKGHNIELGTTCGFDINKNPSVAALANNGGPTKTMALQTGSPAIDAAAPAFCPATDQRGFKRPDQAGTPCDIGAFEFTVSAPPPPSPPVNTGRPVVSGTPEPGHQLSCSNGTWSGNPTSFAFRWNKGGAPIAGATSAHYTVQILDEAQTLTCTVTASNAGGSASATSDGVLVAIPGTLGCPKPSGRISGTRLGPLGLGFTRRHARKVLHRHKGHGSGIDEFCLYAGWGIEAGYPGAKLLHELSAKDRRRVRDRIVLLLTVNPFYGFDGVDPGATLAAAQRRLHLGKKIHLGGSDWYFATEKASNLVLKVRNGLVTELGIADKRLSTGRKAQLRLLKGFSAI